MPRSNRGDPKRPHTGDESEQPTKRARKVPGGGDAPNGDDKASNDVVRLSDRGRFSWQSKGKWKAKSPRSKSAPASRGPSRISIDPIEASTSKQPMSAPASASALDTPAVTTPPTISTVTSSKAPPNDQELALQAELARLRKELEDKNKVISRNENVMDAVRTSMQCGICYEPFTRPCVVVPCGHISCQNCLIEWFTSPASAEQGARPKRKTCPHCRGAVLSRPVEVFGLAPAAAVLAGQSDPSAAVPAFGPATTDADPWAKLFPAVAKPYQDDEDGVLRCPDCLHEIWAGECTHCGRVFTDESGESAYGSDDGSISVYPDGSVYRGISLYDGSIFGGGSDEGEGDSLYGSEVERVAEEFAPRIPVMYDSYEDEDDDDSFIDDSELPPVPPAAYFHHYAPSESDAGEEGDGYHSAEPSNFGRTQTVRVSSSESDSDQDMDDSDLEEEDDFLPPRGRRGRSAETETTAPVTGIETAEEADDEDEDEVNPNATINLVSDDDDAPVRPIGRARMAASWGWAAQQPPRGRSGRRIESPELELGSESGSEYYSE